MCWAPVRRCTGGSPLLFTDSFDLLLRIEAGRKKKAEGKGREMRKKKENVGIEGKRREINEKEGKGREKYKTHCFFHNLRKQHSKNI